jgi:hypothetical protein
LVRRLPDGSTERDMLLSVERQTGKTPAALEDLPLPADAEHIWHWFLALHAGRSSNGFGPNPISWSDISAWISITQTIVRPSEIAAIMMVDRLWLEQRAADIEASRKANDKPRR